MMRSGGTVEKNILTSEVGLSGQDHQRNPRPTAAQDGLFSWKLSSHFLYY